MSKYFSEWYNEFISANKNSPTWDDVILAVEKFTSTNTQNMQLPTECPDPNCGAPIKVIAHHSAQCRYCR